MRNQLMRIEAKLDHLQEDVTVLKSEMGMAKKGMLAVLALIGALITWTIALFR